MTLQELIAGTRNGGRVTLTEDVSEAVTVPIGKKVTIDLGGHTWTAPQGESPIVIDGASITVSNGRIVSDGKYAIRVGSKGSTLRSSLVLTRDVSIEVNNHAGIFISKGAEIQTSADITVHGEFGCVQGNGSEPHWGNSCIVFDGNLVSDGTAIYWPQVGDLVIQGGTIKGTTGVEIRAGSLQVRGGTIIGTAVPTTVTPNGNGTTSLGCGVAVAQHTTAQPTEATISRGDIQGFTAVYEGNPEGNSDTSGVSLVITGGTFTPISGGTVAVFSESLTGKIRGGEFHGTIPADMIAPGYEMTVAPDGSTAVAKDVWTGPDASPVGVGLIGFSRYILRNPSLKYTKGGFKVDGFNPTAILGVSVEGGATAYLDRATGRIILYRNGAEAEGELKDVTIVLIGN